MPRPAGGAIHKKLSSRNLSLPERVSPARPTLGCTCNRSGEEHIVARPVRKKTNWVFAVGRLTACDALAASLCGLVVRVGEYGEVSKACAVQRAASAVVSSSPFVQQASLGSSSGGWMTPAAGWNLSRPHNGRQWLNRSVLTYSRGSEPLALRRRAQ